MFSLSKVKIMRHAGVFCVILSLFTPNQVWGARDKKDGGGDRGGGRGGGRVEQRSEKVQERRGGGENRGGRAAQSSDRQRQNRAEPQQNRVEQRQRAERRQEQRKDRQEESREERREDRQEDRNRLRERIEDRVDRRLDRRRDRWDNDDDGWRDRRYYRSYDPFVVRTGGFVGFTIRPRPYYYDYSSFQSAPVEIAVQVELRQLGYYGGSVDGDIGPGTRDAIRRYQIANGLYPSGHINRELLDSLDII